MGGGVGGERLQDDGRRLRRATHAGLAHHREAGLGNAHLVERERAGLVRADHRGRTDRLGGGHTPHQVVGGGHAPHAVGEAERHAHRQALRHGDDDDGDGHHEVAQQLQPGRAIQPARSIRRQHPQRHAQRQPAGHHRRARAEWQQPAAQAAALQPAHRLARAPCQLEGVVNDRQPHPRQRGQRTHREQQHEQPVVAKNRQLAHDHAAEHQRRICRHRHAEAHHADQLAQAFELRVERGDLVRLLGGGSRDLADARAIANSRQRQQAAARRHQRAAKHTLLVALRLTRRRLLGDGQ